MPQRGLEEQVQRRFGQTLRRLRKAKGLTQETLALDANLNRTYVGSVERGERNVSLVNIYRLARALRISPKDLF